MKRKVLLGLLGGLIVFCLIGIGVVVMRDVLMSPADCWMAAKQEIQAQNYPKALRLMKRAADGDFPRAQYDLALMYDVGDKIPENREEAKKYLQEALRNGLTEAHYVRAVWEERGYYGEPDEKTALNYYEMAALRGHKNAIKSLIALYGEGVGGFPYNLKRQAHWVQKLEEKGQKGNKK